MLPGVLLYCRLPWERLIVMNAADCKDSWQLESTRT